MFDKSKIQKIRKVVSHKNCADGLMSAMIVKAALFAQVEDRIEFVQYNTREHAKLKAEEGLLFVDMTPPPDRVQEFIDCGALILDHHKGQEDMLKLFGEDAVYADKPGVSGAVLASYLYRSIHEDGLYYSLSEDTLRMRYLAQLVGIRDTWQRDSEFWDEANNLSAALRALPEKLWLDEVTPLLPFSKLTLGLVKMGHYFRNDHIQSVEESLTKCTRVYGKDYVADVLNSTHSPLISDIAESRRSKPELSYSKLDVVIGYQCFSTEDGRYKMVCTMRSVADDFDVLSIAKRFPGGGGHTKAGGFAREFDRAPTISPLELIKEVLHK